ELLAAMSADEVARAPREAARAEDGADAAERVVAGGVPLGVVERLEVIDVDHQEPDRRARPHGALPLPFERDLEGAAVGEAGQRVAGGEGLELAVGDLERFSRRLELPGVAHPPLGLESEL